MIHFFVRHPYYCIVSPLCGQRSPDGILSWVNGDKQVNCPDCLKKGMMESRFTLLRKGDVVMSVDGDREYKGNTVQEQLEFERTLGEPMKKPTRQELDAHMNTLMKKAAEPMKKLVHMIDSRSLEREWTLCGHRDVEKSDNCLSVTCLYCLNGLKAHVESQVTKILDGGIKSVLPVTKQEELNAHWEKCQKALEDFASVDKCSKEFRSFEDLCKQVEALEKKIDTLLSGFKQPAEVYVPPAGPPDARHPFFGGVVKLGEGTMYGPSLHGVIKNNSLNF